MLKEEFRLCGEDWKQSQDKHILNKLHALVGAINELEMFIYGRRITTLMDCM